MQASQGKIMVVDDNAANLRLLEAMLLERGYEVRSFPRGLLALAVAAREPPDLILLDINMPEMTGYEVCQRLKADPALSGIPVIFLSALSETADKVKAFRSGGVDYISKPFQLEEVHARVETHLNVANLQRELERQKEILEETVAARTRELAEAHKRLTILDCAKTEFLSLISHEFRTPLNGLLGVGQLILDEMPSMQETKELQDLYERARERILSILDDALLLAQIDVTALGIAFGPVALRTALSGAIDAITAFSNSRRVTLIPPPVCSDLVHGEEELLVRAFHALIETAVKLSGAGETVRLTRELGDDSVMVLIESRGRTVPLQAMSKFFDLFSISEPITSGADLGLGPPVAYRILSLLGGSVTVTNLDPPGIRLAVSLKDADPAHQTVN